MHKPLLPAGQYRIITARLELAEVLKEAKKKKCDGLRNFWARSISMLSRASGFSEPRRPHEHFISLEIPVNLRQFFKTKTNRNFSLFILLSEKHAARGTRFR